MSHYIHDEIVDLHPFAGHLYLMLITILTYLIPQRATSPLLLVRSICHQQSTDHLLHFRLWNPPIVIVVIGRALAAVQDQLLLLFLFHILFLVFVITHAFP